MITSIYGGFFYPGTPFVFDKVYKNYTEAMKKCSTDDILIGRYILIKYANTAFSLSEKQAIEAVSSATELTTELEKEYYNNYKIDQQLYGSCDNIVCRKSYDATTKQYSYVKITNLTLDVIGGVIEDTAAAIVNSEQYKNDIASRVSTGDTLKWQVFE